MSEVDRQLKRMRELYESSIAIIRKYQQEREGLLQRVEVALFGIDLVSDSDWQRRLAKERYDRCIVLWNGLRLLTDEYDQVFDIHNDKLKEIVTVILEGGPLGHQAKLEDGVDVLNISDLERASGAIRYRERSEQEK